MRQTALGRGGHDAIRARSGQALAAVARQVERGVRPHFAALKDGISISLRSSVVRQSILHLS